MYNIIKVIMISISLIAIYFLYKKRNQNDITSRIPQEVKDVLKNQMPHRVYGDERTWLLKPDNKFAIFWVVMDVFLLLLCFSSYTFRVAENKGAFIMGFVIVLIPLNLIFFLLWLYDNKRFCKYEKIYLTKGYIYTKSVMKYGEYVRVAYYDFLDDSYASGLFQVENHFKAKGKTDYGSYVNIYIVEHNNKLKFLKSEFSEINQFKDCAR